MSERDERELAAIAAGKCPACGNNRPDPSTVCPHCGAAALGPADAGRPAAGARPAGKPGPLDALMQVRASDIEPYVGLRYLSKLFKLMGVILLLLLVAEIVVGIARYGTEAIPTLLGETSKLIVAAGLLWGIGDLAILLIDVGHDVRAARILLGRQAVHHAQEHHRTPAPADVAVTGDRGAHMRRDDRSVGGGGRSIGAA